MPADNAELTPYGGGPGRWCSHRPNPEPTPLAPVSVYSGLLLIYIISVESVGPLLLKGNKLVLMSILGKIKNNRFEEIFLISSLVSHLNMNLLLYQ